MDGMGSEIDWICSLKEFIAKLSVSLAKVIILSDQGAPGCLGYIGMKYYPVKKTVAILAQEGLARES